MHEISCPLKHSRLCRSAENFSVVLLLLLLLLMTFIGRKLRHAANAPSQPLHDYSYPRTGTFSVVSLTLAVKCSADGGRLEDCSTRLAREHAYNACSRVTINDWPVQHIMLYAVAC